MYYPRTETKGRETQGIGMKPLLLEIGTDEIPAGVHRAGAGGAGIDAAAEAGRCPDWTRPHPDHAHLAPVVGHRSGAGDPAEASDQRGCRSGRRGRRATHSDGGDYGRRQVRRKARPAGESARHRLLPRRGSTCAAPAPADPGPATAALRKRSCRSSSWPSPFPKRMRWADLEHFLCSWPTATGSSSIGSLPIGLRWAASVQRAHVCSGAPLHVPASDQRRRTCRLCGGPALGACGRGPGRAPAPDRRGRRQAAASVRRPPAGRGTARDRDPSGGVPGHCRRAVCRAFLELPAEVFITAMREHQRYFAVVDIGGNPAAFYCRTTAVQDMAVVVRGHERCRGPDWRMRNFSSGTTGKPRWRPWWGS